MIAAIILFVHVAFFFLIRRTAIEESYFNDLKWKPVVVAAPFYKLGVTAKQAGDAFQKLGDAMRNIPTPPYELTDEDKVFFDQQTSETLLEWGWLMNRWEWPEGIPNPEPPRHIRNGRRSVYLRYIRHCVGHKAELYYHNVTRRDHFTPEEFALWWSKRNTNEPFIKLVT